jgi:hypothetical protein
MLAPEGLCEEEPAREHPVLYQEAGVGAVVRIYWPEVVGGGAI